VRVTADAWHEANRAWWCEQCGQWTTLTPEWHELHRQLVGAGFAPDDAQDIMSIVALWGGELVMNMADLRAKVQAERDKHGPGRAHDRGVPYPCGHCDALEFVLALIDSGADQ
jgi:hypothetical protein